MREDELREHAKCSLCGRGVGHTGIPIFWLLKIERHGVIMDALRRNAGLSMMLGSAALARILGPDEEMTKQLKDPVELTICEECATEKDLPVAALAEYGESDRSMPPRATANQNSLQKEAADAEREPDPEPDPGD